MARICVNFDEVSGKIKPMHATGQPPFLGGFCKLDFSYINYLKEANIPYSRLHDVGGAFGSNRYVDIPNIFRNFDADENDPASYDFAFTDALLEGMYEYDVEPIFRLGVTIENQCHIKAYHIHPPKDFMKWARICEHIVRHYNEGWADGYHYGIKYWEIWNEPENSNIVEKNQMWTGTAEQYYELYDITSKHLKSCFGDSIKVGGYAACGFYKIFDTPEKYGLNIERREGVRYSSEKEQYRIDFLYGFLEYISSHKSPIDFFSWHTYLSTEENAIMSDFVNKVLTEYGYANIETILDEWNNVARVHDSLGTSFAAAEAATMLLVMQNKPTSMLCYYDSRIMSSSYCGMFNCLTKKPYCLYYVFYAFGQLYSLGNQVKCTVDEKGIYAVAASDAGNKAVMITNTSGADVKIETNIAQDFDVYLIDEEHLLEKVDAKANGFVLKQNQVVLIKN